MGCIAESSCVGLYNAGGQYALDRESNKTIFNQAILTPYVKVLVQGDDDYITIGNQSSTSKGGSPNSAAIKSFHWGRSLNAGATIEIIDEEGGNFHHFFERIVKNFNGVGSADYTIKMEWGWLGLNCNDEFVRVKTSHQHTLLLSEVTIQFGTLLKFTLHGQDIVEYLDRGTSQAVFGKPTQKMEIREAIKQLLESSTPSISKDKVVFLTAENQPLKFKPDKIEGVWHVHGEDPITATMRWLQKYTTENGKGIIPVWDDVGNRLIYLEDPGPNCKTGKEPNVDSIGTYIVGGGKLFKRY